MAEPDLGDALSIDTYALGRGYAAASRLNQLYYMWKETLGYDLHPSLGATLSAVGETDQIRIADVGCGTGIWLRSVAQSLPHAKLDGFDISLAQCPPIQWLPENIHSLKEWDVFRRPPEDLQGRFDIVHVRLLFVVVQDEDPKPILENLMLLLKPGGYLQWDELDVSGSYVLKVRDDVQAFEIERTRRSLNQIGQWVGRLPNSMSECGLVQERIWRYQERKDLAMAVFENHLAKDAEMAATRLKGTAEGEALQRSIKLMHHESREGAVICTPKVVCVGRKP